MNSILLPKAYIFSMITNVIAAITVINGVLFSDDLMIKVVSILLTGGLLHLSFVFKGFAEKRN